MSNTIAFLCGLVIGGAVVGILIMALLWVAIEYREHPEYMDDAEEDY